MNQNDGGYVIPAGMIDQMYELWSQPSVFRSEPLPPLKGWRRIRVNLLMARDSAIGRLHDRLFGDRYCNHDGCD